MTILNATPLPLFLTFEEVTAYLPDVPLNTTLTFAGHRIVPVGVLAPGLDFEEFHEVIWLTGQKSADAVRTTSGELRFEYGATHLDVILALAEEQETRAWDAAAFIAQQVFPDLTVLDSTKTPLTTLNALPHHTGVDQRSFHGMSNFPLSVVPPPWFPKAGMPNVVFS